METVLDYYKTLELDDTASEEQIWLSYHKLTYLFRQGKLPGGWQRFSNIQQAYWVLKHPIVKIRYDNWYNEHIKKRRLAHNSALIALSSGFFSAIVVSLFITSQQHAVMEVLKLSAVFLLALFAILAFLKKAHVPVR